MTMPSDERKLWEKEQQAVIDEVNAADAVSKEDDFRENLRTDALRMKDACPYIWEALDILTRPRVADSGLPGILPPPADLTFGERAAYRMGQDAIGIWLRALADIKQDEDHDNE